MMDYNGIPNYDSLHFFIGNQVRMILYFSLIYYLLLFFTNINEIRVKITHEI